MVDGVAQQVPVTAATLGLVLVILFVATAAAKNLPALLEILLLQTESVSAGGRYAIKTLVSYGITVAAFLVAFSTLGLNWGQVQWLVAALGVGIGFGLQEIVANFISGIIILFERPVRVGDIVTIGDTTGVVTNIQIRATTIRNWDRQELSGAEQGVHHGTIVELESDRSTEPHHDPDRNRIRKRHAQGAEHPRANCRTA
jgi:potassium-dependent mechanosensitive channel